jgi:hypothetical protein
MIQVATVLSGLLGIIFMALMVASASAILKAGGYTGKTLKQFLIRSVVGVVFSLTFVVLIIFQASF